GDIDWARDDVVAAITERFHARHEELYTYALRGQEPVLVNARVAVIGTLDAPPAEPRLGERPPAGPVRQGRVWLDGWR
ncbi:MAG TPA: hydantoinase/oxoprolinase family protein, partial [Hyphomicrobiaceae bacterium]|nr:hydantoinase/oxoprolinase family protein [Hyphomicrobiaceae bacterium]